MNSFEILQKETVGRSWYRADLDRRGAEALLAKRPCHWHDLLCDLRFKSPIALHRPNKVFR